MNKKPGWVPPLLFKADVNFSQFSNLVFGRCLTGRLGIIPAPQNSFESTQYYFWGRIANPIFRPYSAKPLSHLSLTNLHYPSSFNHSPPDIPANSQNLQKCPKFRFSHTQMNNYTSQPIKLIVGLPMGQIWAYFISTSI